MVFKKCVIFGNAKKKIGKSTRNLYLNKLRVREVSSFPFPNFCFLLQISMNISIISRFLCETAVISYVFL